MKENEANPLDVMTEKWMKLERKTLKQREAAERFYEKNLMKLIEDDFIRRNQAAVTETVEYLILSVGTSYEPLVLNICLLQPKQILFLCTRTTEQYLKKIVNYCNLQVEHYQKTIVSETDPNDIYYEELNVNKKVQDLAGKILEMKKQKRGLDKNIAKLERELEMIFDETGTDCLEIEIGLLVRRKMENGYEWIVEI